MTACIAAMPTDALAAVNAAAAPKRPGGKKWSEVCEQVQKPDGSVRTSPPFKSWQDVTLSPPRPRPFSQHLGKLGRTGPSERSSVGGSSRGGSSRAGSHGRSSRTSGRSSRSSTPAIAREGDVSSRCSSGGRDTSTNSSVMSREGDTPREVSVTIDGSVPSPSQSGSKGLLMPDPIRPLALLAGEDAEHGEVMPGLPEGEDSSTVDVADGESRSTTETGSPSEAGGEVAELKSVGPVVQLGLALKRDPYGRDAPRRSDEKSVWTPEPLAKYLRGVAAQIDTNIQNKRLPTAEKLDAFVNRLVAHTHRQLRHAPKKIRHSLTGLCARRFHRFWNFARNEKVRSTTPEELTSVLRCIIEALLSEVVIGNCAIMVR